MAGWGRDEQYASSNQEKRDSEDKNVWHSALRFLRSKRPRVYSQRKSATMGALVGAPKL